MTVVDNSTRPTTSRPHAPGLTAMTPRDWLGPLLAVLAAACWLIGLLPIDPTTLGSFGLLPELSPLLLLAYPLLVAAFMVELRVGRTPVLTVLTILAVFAVYGLQPAVEPAGRLPVAWLHVGFADYINSHGAILHNFDARFSWPGFFALVAMVTGASGLKDASALIPWAPVVLSGVATLLVRAIAQAVFDRDRTAWLAAWIFLAGNWTEQDYLSPQGSTYLLLLAGLAVTLRYLVRPGVLEPVQKGQFLRPPVPDNAPRDRMLAQVLVVLLGFALAPSHQLSPYMLAGLLFVLLICGRLWSRWLPVVVLLTAVAWFVLGAKEFWISQLHLITGSIGDLGTSVNDGFTQRLSDNLGRESILAVRVGITGVTGLLAALGAIGLRRRRQRSLSLLLMSAAAFGLAVAQPYGGEILIRCYLFALPFVALLGAVVLDAVTWPTIGRTWSRTWLRRAATGGAAVVLAGLMLAVVTARGGNDAYVAFTKADLAVARQAYARAADGQSVDTVAAYTPTSDWQRVGVVRQAALETHCEPFPDPWHCVLRAKPDFLILNAAQDAYGQIYYAMPAGWIQTLANQLVHAGLYRQVYVDAGSQLLELTTDLTR